MATAILIGERDAFDMVVKARKSMQAGEEILTALPGVMTHTRGGGVRGNFPPFPRRQYQPVKVHAKECGHRTCTSATSNWRTVINGTSLMFE